MLLIRYIQGISLNGTKIIEAYSYISIPVVQSIMKRTKIILTILLLLVTFVVSAQRVTTINDAEKKELAKKMLALDYSMPDYSIKKIDAKVMGPRLANILESLCANYNQPVYLGSLSVIQSSQVEGLNYGRIKSMKLENVTKTAMNSQYVSIQLWNLII